MNASSSTLTVDGFDGCAEFDERLLESAFAPTIDAAVDVHLARCGRCRRARDLYLATADALSVALSSGAPRTRGRPSIASRSGARPPALSESAAQTRPASRKPWGALVYGLAAASVLVAAAWLAHVNTSRRADLSIVSTGDDARIELREPRHAALRQGTAEFEIGDGESSVDTPLGRVRGKNAKFRISTSLRNEAPEMSHGEAALLVTVFVTSGVAWWSSKDEGDVAIGAGETLVRPKPKLVEVPTSAGERELTPASAFGQTRSQ